jgi:cytidine deaminase
MDDRVKSFNKALEGFPHHLRHELESLAENGGILEEALVNRLMHERSIDIRALMMKLLPVAAAYARVPVSGFKVGAVALGMGDPGALYLGANMEFTGQALSFCVHGEQSAFTNAWIHGEQGLQALAINAAPCGYCRQFLYELACEKQLEILLKQEGSSEPAIYKIAGLLPKAFGPSDLGITSKLMQPENHGLTLRHTPDEVAAAALKAANASYSPYSKNYSGIAIKGSDGQIYTGRYVENAAYNPSMSPLESALTFMNMNITINTTTEIVDVVLVERTSVISQVDAASAVLSSMTDVPLRYYEATR